MFLLMAFVLLLRPASVHRRILAHARAGIFIRVDGVPAQRRFLPCWQSESSGINCALVARRQATHARSPSPPDAWGGCGAGLRAGGVEKYSSIASRQAPEHGSMASSVGPDSRISAAIFSAQLMQSPARSIPQPVQLQLDL